MMVPSAHADGSDWVRPGIRIENLIGQNRLPVPLGEGNNGGSLGGNLGKPDIVYALEHRERLTRLNDAPQGSTSAQHDAGQ
jgi:hypothetical protein